MDIILEQNYDITNLITISGKYTVSEFQSIVQEISSVFKEYAIENGSKVITTTKSIEMINGEQYIDVDVLLPICYQIPIKEPYYFKNKLSIKNAIYTKVNDITKLQEKLIDVNQYISDNKLQPITSAYLIQSMQDNKLIVEIYIGINPNIL